ncbi:MAG: alpha-L-rhamnosidase, partial [Microbacterium sp.]|nr:alpha-L-rhamnosidase [Microbacterium sp.]
MTSTPHTLQVDSGGDEFVVTGSTPRLSFQMPAGFGTQVSAAVEASVDGVTYPIAEVVGDRHRFIEWPFAPLRSGQRVSWRVRVSATDGESGWSAPHTFEAGLLDEDWRAAWISPVEDELGTAGTRPAYALYAEFSLPDEVVSARLYATALGVYVARINGERLGAVELAPGSSSYDRTLYAQAYDVPVLVPGVNRIELILSDGWYRGEVGAFRVPAGWGSVTGARAELHVLLANGETHIVRTGADWSSAPSGIPRASLMDGETFDPLSSRSAPVPVRCAAVDGPPISWSPAPPVRVIETREPIVVRPVREGVWVADFGQNASGWIRLTDLGPAGTRTVIEHGEFVASDGDLSTSHLDSTRPGEPPVVFTQRDEVIS